MTTGWVIFVIFSLLGCLGMAAFTAISTCKYEIDDDTPEEDKDE